MLRYHLTHLAILSLALFPSFNTWADQYEKPPTLSADKFFSNIPLTGNSYSIEPEVPTDGFMTRTVIHSDFGDFVSAGPDMLEIRLHEIEALEKLQTFESSDEFNHGARESTSQKFSALKSLYEHPDEAASGIGEGVNRFFKRVYRSGKTGVQKVDDVMHKRTPGSNDEAGPGEHLPGWSISKPIGEAETVSKYEKVARASGGLAVDLLGFDESRRGLAKRLAVDPYTSNPVLDKKLDEVTWSIFAGDLGIDLVTSLIPGAILVSASSMVESLVWDSPPGDLLVRIEQSLLTLGVDQESVDRMLRHQYYPLSYQTVLTKALEDLSDVQGVADIMPLTLSVTTVDQARYVVYTMRMLAEYHRTVEALDSILVEGTVVALDKQDELIVTAPLDYISWSSALDQFSQREIFTRYHPQLHVTREMSDLARTRLQDRGWSIHENSRLFQSLIPTVESTGPENQKEEKETTEESA